MRDSFKYSGAGPADDPAWRVDIAPGRSRRAQAWVMAVAAAALAATLAADLSGPAKLAVAGALGMAALHAARRHGGGAGAVRRLAVDLAGRVEVERADGRLARGRLAQGAFVAPWLTVVRWVPEGARFPRVVTIVPDAVEAGAFRRLRILLRWR
jgi:hypothetical protein